MESQSNKTELGFPELSSPLDITYTFDSLLINFNELSKDKVSSEEEQNEENTDSNGMISLQQNQAEPHYRNLIFQHQLVDPLIHAVFGAQLIRVQIVSQGYVMLNNNSEFEARMIVEDNKIETFKFTYPKF